MFFLLRMAFWLSLVLILLPSGSAQQGPPPNDVRASEAISAASATVQDLRGFCIRQPDACTVGSQMATEIGYRMRAGAKMLYDFLTETLAHKGTGSVPSGAGQTGGIAQDAGDSTTPQPASQNTLTSKDLMPAWRGLWRKDTKPAA